MKELKTVEEIKKLSVQSVLIVKESEFGDHVAWQLTDDVLAYKNSPAAEDVPDVAWASTYYKQEHDAEDLLTMSYDGKVYVAYEHPGK